MCENCLKNYSDGIRTDYTIKSVNDFLLRNEVRKVFAIIKADDWERIASELSDLLIQNWDAQKKEGITNLIRMIKGSIPFSDADLKTALGILQAQLGDAFAQTVAGSVTEVNLKGYQLGVMEAASLKAGFSVINQAAIDWLDEHQIFWVKSHFDRLLAGDVAKAGQSVIRDGLSRDAAASYFQKLFKDKFDVASYAYWDGFANHVTTRAREFGNVEGYVRSGAKFLRVVAVLDHRTSGVCRYMNNRIIKVADAVELRDKMMAAENPEDVKAIAPFLKEDEVKGTKTSSLKNVSLGYALPPYHFDCRSRTVIYKAPATKLDFKKNKKLGTNERDFLNTFTQEELELHVSDLLKQKRFAVNDDQKEVLSTSFAELSLDSDTKISSFMKSNIRKSKGVALQAYFNDTDKDLHINFVGADYSVTLNSAYEVFDFRKKGKTLSEDFAKFEPDSLLSDL